MTPPPTPPTRSGLLPNLAWLSGANLLVKPLWFLFITAACMRVLGAAGYGTLSASMAMAAMAVVLVEFGTGEYVTKEVARAPDIAPSLFSNVLAGRLAGGGASIAVVLVVGWVLGYTAGEMTALLAAACYTLAFRLTELCRSLFRAFEVLRYEAYSLLVERVLVIGFGIGGLLLFRTPAGALMGMATGTAFTLALSIGWVRARLIPIHARLLDRRTLRAAYLAALPIGLFGVAAAVLNQAGAVVIEAARGNVEAGQYGAGYRIIEMLMLLPTIACAAILPRLSALHRSNKLAEYRRLIRLSAVGLSGSGVALAAGLTVLAPTVVRLLARGPEGAGAFEATGELLRLLGWAYPLMALAMLFSFALIAADGQHFVARLVSVAAVLNLAMDAALVSRYGSVAAAWALIGCQGIVVGGCLWYLRYAFREHIESYPVLASFLTGEAP